ncbi:glycosyltransferase [Planctomycetota bacterium]
MTDGTASQRPSVTDADSAQRHGPHSHSTTAAREARVLIIVPTKDQPELLTRCVDSIERTVAVERYRLVIVDTGCRSPDGRRVLRRLGTRHEVLRYGLPFNYAKVNNWAASRAAEELLLFLNDDVEATDPGWLEVMADLARRPPVGAVGALLTYPDMTIQHAGVALGTPSPTLHLGRGAPPSSWRRDPLYASPYEVPAVTGAAMMCRRSVFEALSGFDEKFSYAYNDVDLCLRLRRRGLRVLLEPRARLIHLESATRGRYHKPAEESRFIQRWRGVLVARDTRA